MKLLRVAEKENREGETEEGLKKCQDLTHKLSDIKAKKEK
jgi:hypothetical protein